MGAQPFAYAAPSTLADAVRLMAERGPDAMLIGGGTWAIPNLATATGTKLVLDLRRLNLRDIAIEGDHVTIGACVTYDMLQASDVIRMHAPLFALMAAQITGGPQIRGNGTLCGSACYANPASDAPACLAAVRASLIAVSQNGSREIAAHDFFLAPFRTALAPDEIVVSIRVPIAPEGARAGYHKLKICEGSWPIVTAACIAGPLGADGSRALSIGIGAACPTPHRYETKVPADASGSALRGVAAAAASVITDEWADELAGPGYRRSVAPSVIETALRLSLREHEAR